MPSSLANSSLPSSSRPASTKPGTPVRDGNGGTSGRSSLLLRKQLIELQKNPVDGFSAGLVDDDNILEWQIVIMGLPSLHLHSNIHPTSFPNRPADTLYEGAILKARLIFPENYPDQPPKMIFDSEMWHPNVYSTSDKRGEVCISILHAPGEDEWGYEDAGERWLPVHSVETVLISVISLLSADVPDLNSPANVDAAKEVRENFASYKKKVKRLARRSAEEAYE